MHEGKTHERNSFVTLTYDEAHLPKDGSLNYPDFQRFLRRLRKYIAPNKVRFYMCGEYGGQLGRPHFHALLFGVDWDDRVYSHTTGSGCRLYRSALLERLWPLGLSSVGDLTFESAAYIARYCVQKITGRDAQAHYGNLVPEFNQASRKPGIGAAFFDRYQSDIFPADHCIINAKESTPPRYYTNRYKRLSAFAAQLYEDEIQPRREARGRARYLDNTPERLQAKEAYAAARAQLLVRTIE